VCGRYVQVSSPTLLAERFEVDEVALSEPPEPDYNVAPRKEVLTVVQRRHARGDEGSGPVRTLEQMRWGLVPTWAEDPKIGDRLINARAESVAEKAAFKTAFRKRRCILPADGFYEWEPAPGRKKQPVFVHRRDGEPIAFAGLWEVWRDSTVPDAPWLLTCAIVTTRANAVMEPIHDRMPVMLPETEWRTWLDPDVADLARLEAMLVPPPDDEIELWPVSTRVNSADNNGPDLVERFEPVEPDTLF
jgi:putative SOS response-associated peptidase YedK